MSADESTVRKLVHVVALVATEPCEAEAAEQEPCPLHFDDQEHWCLSCLARKALSEYMNGA
jgi:hypothetical protein